MSGATIIDLVLLLVIAGQGVTAYKIGLVASGLSLVGLLAGAVLGLWLLPLGLAAWGPGGRFLQVMLLVVGTVLLASLGQQLGRLLGWRLRSLVPEGPLRAIDSVLGAVAGVVATALIAWFLAAAALPALPPPAASAVTESRALQGINRIVPGTADRVVARAGTILGEGGVPRVFSGLERERIRPVDPPPEGVADGRGVAAAARSVVEVRGTAATCSREQEGSGWVAAPERVVTNAHVVAGLEHPSVLVGGKGEPLPATTVAFDPGRDVAVLAVPGLDAPALPTGESLEHGDPVIAAGFPRGGAYHLSTGAVRSRLVARGNDIQGNPGAVRQVYATSAKVVPGNSGGPLLSPTGQVVGTVFANSTAEATTSYALTLEETRPVIEKASDATESVPTGSCVSAP
ncbi:MarP family serine protease [Janibacter corallicola]|uniref:MarP family serine protease n=1 Tax=Janibacter corallicola TaxID=415212 RepID=UPI00082C07CC|nr:MarP family serine protease [Janibacter corallicola]